MIKNLDLLICFLVKTKKLKFFEAKLKNENIEYSKEKNDDWYNFRFNDKHIEIIKYYILYFKLVIQNIKLDKSEAEAASFIGRIGTSLIHESFNYYNII